MCDSSVGDISDMLNLTMTTHSPKQTTSIVADLTTTEAETTVGAITAATTELSHAIPEMKTEEVELSEDYKHLERKMKNVS